MPFSAGVRGPLDPGQTSHLQLPTSGRCWRSKALVTNDSIVGTSPQLAMTTSGSRFNDEILALQGNSLHFSSHLARGWSLYLKDGKLKHAYKVLRTSFQAQSDHWADAKATTSGHDPPETRGLIDIPHLSQVSRPAESSSPWNPIWNPPKNTEPKTCLSLKPLAPLDPKNTRRIRGNAALRREPSATAP